jgi:hypothetical protein
MIRQALASGVKVLLLTPTPDETTNLEQPAQDLADHRAQIIALAEEYGVGLVDSWDAFRRRVAAYGLENLLSYKNHPNRRGHELVRDELLRWF